MYWKKCVNINNNPISVHFCKAYYNSSKQNKLFKRALQGRKRMCKLDVASQLKWHVAISLN